MYVICNLKGINNFHEYRVKQFRVRQRIKLFSTNGIAFGFKGDRRLSSIYVWLQLAVSIGKMSTGKKIAFI